MTQKNTEDALRDVTIWNYANMSLLASVTRLRDWKFAPQSRFESNVLVQLAPLRGLLFLAFENSELESQNLRALANFKALRHLTLTGCRFATKDFIFLCDQWAKGACPNLTRLLLDETSVDDEVTRSLGKVEQLRALDLRGTAVSDAGIEHVTGLKKLESLGLYNTRVSPEGMAKLVVLPRLGIGVPQSSTSRALDTKQVEDAEIQLREFLKQMEKWGYTAIKRLDELDNQRVAESLTKEDAFQRKQEFWNETIREKDDIVKRV